MKLNSLCDRKIYFFICDGSLLMSLHRGVVLFTCVLAWDYSASGVDKGRRGPH